MPLLKKKEFKKAPLPKELRENEEVFHCVMTNEIFRDYEEFCQRVILCNSMVWTCRYTEKSNLTYLEALESEQEVEEMLKDFPTELRIPLLFLASKTSRSSFSEIADDVYAFMKDRYFIGENVEASFVDNKWKESHILQVIAPSEEQLKGIPKNGHVNDKHFYPPASKYSYEVEQLDAEDDDITEIMIVNANQIKRSRKFTREKCKLFLKQYVIQNEDGILAVKERALETFGINKIKFEKIFDGPLPNFAASKNKRKSKQGSITHFLNNSNGAHQENTISLLEKMRKREEEYKQVKEDIKQKKLAEKLKQREENIKISALLKEWYTPKEDLELEDHKKLPVPAPLQSKVPEKYIGDMLAVVEFAHSFSKFTRTKSFFPNGLTFDLMERALLEKEIDGPLIDIIQMLLSTIFYLQNEETLHTNIKIDSAAADEKVKDVNDNISLTEATYLATKASTWSLLYQGIPLSSLPLYTLTTTEILRLHLLSSGARVNDTGSKWRYQLRGGYTSEDDPALHLRLKYPHILKALALHNINELPIGDILKIIHCLLNQIISYSDIRDLIEDGLEKSRQAKIDLKILQVNDRKHDQEYVSAKVKIMREKESGVEWSLEKLAREYEKKKAQNARQIKNLMKLSTKYQSLLGQDRAFRQYLKLESIPGLLVHAEEDAPGTCLDECVKQIPELVDAEKSAVLAHIHKLQEEMNNSDKENQVNKNKEQVNEPKKLNGMHTALSDEASSLLMCCADPSKCVVHSTKAKQQKWGFFYEDKQIDELIDSLNERGLRENELKQVLVNDRDDLLTFVCQTPVSILNPQIQRIETEGDLRFRTRKPIGRPKYENPNFGYPSEMDSATVLQSVLIDNILEIEENVSSGSIGSIKVKNRDVWRDNVKNKNFELIIKSFLSKKDNSKKVDKLKNESSNSRPSTPDINKEYKDPGVFLKSIAETESDDSDVNYNEFLSQSDDQKTAVQALACALVQVAQGIEDQYLKKPLGHTALKSDTKTLKSDLLEKWEQSLMAASSYSQIFLHYGTLNQCILWTRSALLAKCQICRKQSDAESMILCDNCNKGQHLFCFRPKLTAVPKGSWYCKECQKENDKQAKLANPEPKPQKRRRIFTDESEEETEESETTVDEEQTEEEEASEEQEEEQSSTDDKGTDSTDASTEDEDEPKSVDADEICSKCAKGGMLLCCDNCPGMYHLECAEPPVRRVPRGDWLCHKCRPRKMQSSDHHSMWNAQRSGIINNQRRCAARARDKIQGFARSLRRISESEDSDSTSGGENTNSRRSKRREIDNRDDLPLHNAPLQEVLADVLKQEYAWPFIRPVVKNEVPDYYEIITKPMDFGTIKYKLNMGEYKCDADLMDDAALVFDNCNTYNSSDDEVYHCGVKLLKYFVNKCQECGLKVPEKMESEIVGDSAPPQPKRMCID